MTTTPALADLQRHDPIHLSPPDVGALEEHYLLRALHSGWVAPLGPEVDAFERDLAHYCSREHCVALISGTAALHLALLTAEVGPGDVVLTSSLTFAATANAISYTGAEPFFVDSDRSGNMDPDLLDHAISLLRAEGKAPAAILTVDLLGKSCDHTQIGSIARAHGIQVLSDAAESLGAQRDGLPAASFGHSACVSFNGNKVLTTSGGGALLTDDAQVAQRARYLATQARQPVAHYEHTEIGYNYRLSNLLAAIGRAQLLRLDRMIARRRRVRDWYSEIFRDVPGVSVFRAGDQEDNAWLTAIIVDPNQQRWEPPDLARELAEYQVETRPMWKPMHLQPSFAGCRSVVTGVSESLFHHGLILPSGSGLSEAELERIFELLTGFLRRRS